MIEVMDRLQGDCIDCGLMQKEQARSRAHGYQDCQQAVESGAGLRHMRHGERRLI